VERNKDALKSHATYIADVEGIRCAAVQFFCSVLHNPPARLDDVRDLRRCAHKALPVCGTEQID
jgi:hypothetical protein